MAEAGLFIGWGNPVRGREQKATDVFGEAVELWTALQQSGEIEGFEIAFLEPHGGDLGGFFLLRGEEAKLTAVRGREDFRRVTERADLVVEGLGVVSAILGPGIEEAMGHRQQHVSELA